MQCRSIPRTAPRYNQVRTRNNDSVKKSRRERDETIESINQLEEENEQLMESIKKLKHEYEQLQDLFKQHTGIDIDQLMASQTNATATSSIQPKPVEVLKDVSPKPVLTINTNEDQPGTTTTPDMQLDRNSLDGAIVLINGVQYKIVRIKCFSRMNFFVY